MGSGKVNKKKAYIAPKIKSEKIDEVALFQCLKATEEDAGCIDWLSGQIHLKS